MTVGRTRNAKTNPAGPLGLTSALPKTNPAPSSAQSRIVSTASPACSSNVIPAGTRSTSRANPHCKASPQSTTRREIACAVIRQEGRDAQNRQHPEEPADPIGDVGQIDRFRHGELPRPGADREPVNPHRFDGPGDNPRLGFAAQAGPSSSSRLCRRLEPLRCLGSAGFVVRLGGDMTGEGNEAQHGDSDSQKDRLAHPT